MGCCWCVVCLLGIVNKPEDVGIEGADTVANAAIRKEKGKTYTTVFYNLRVVSFNLQVDTLIASNPLNSNFPTKKETRNLIL